MHGANSNSDDGRVAQFPSVDGTAPTWKLQGTRRDLPEELKYVAFFIETFWETPSSGETPRSRNYN